MTTTFPRIEIELYEPVPDKPGYSRVRARITTQQLADRVNRVLNEAGLRPDEYGMRTLGIAGDKQIPPYRWIACYAVTGGSEGWYIHVDAISPGRVVGDEQTIPHLVTRDALVCHNLLLGKTFAGMEQAYATARALGEMLS